MGDDSTENTELGLDALSLGSGETARTFASDLSGCTNVSFRRVISKFDGNNARHKHMLAMLAAAAEQIKTMGEKSDSSAHKLSMLQLKLESPGQEESDTSYFSCLLLILETTTSEENLSAVVSLLSMVVRSV